MGSTMDLAKFPLEKTVQYAAGVFPGMVALMVFNQAHAGSLGWFFALGFLGYRTKLSLIVLVALVIGNTLTAFLTSVLRWVAGPIGFALGLLDSKPAHLYLTPPWRDPTWRTLAGNRLGTQAPSDRHLMSQETFDLRKKVISEDLPEEQRRSALEDLAKERLDAVKDDECWAAWYEHYHRIVMVPMDQDFVRHVKNGLYFNLEAAALYVLISTILVPSVRQWWIIVPSIIWVLVLLSELLWQVNRLLNKWSTLHEQLQYLSGTRGNAP
jgi:hypothetical protein